MALPYANVPQVFTRWQEAQAKAAALPGNVTIGIDQVTITLRQNGTPFYDSDDLENIHIALDAAAAIAAFLP